MLFSIWGPQLVQLLVQTVIYGTWQDPQVPFLHRFYENWSTLVSPFVGSLVGLLLLFKPAGLLRLIQLSRRMARQEEPG